MRNNSHNHQFLFHRLQWTSSNFMETPLRFLAIAVFLLSSLNSSAQLQIEYQSANVSNDTIFLCGNSSFNLNSTIVGTTSLPLSWSASTISGIGSLSLNSASATQITLTPSTTNQAFYQVSLTQGTGASITYVAVGIPPTLSSAPSQLCENNGPVLLYNSLNSSQSITASAGGLNVSGSSVYLNPQGLSNGAAISITLSEIFTVPGSNSSFICSSNHSITITKPTSPSISLGSSFLIKCQTAATLNISPSGGNFIIRGPGSSMYSPIATSTILNNGNLNTQNLSIGAGQSLGYFYTDANGCESDTAFVTFGVVEPNVGVQAFSAGTYSTVPQSGGVYTWCGNYTSQLFKLNLPNSSNFPTYDIDWGDGISSTGNTNTSNGATHTYSVAGLYDVILTLYNASGCSVTKNLAIFYGTTPPVDLGNPGSLTGCYDGTNGISLFFPINYPLDLPIGLQMTFSSNDGSTPITVTTPLIDTSVSPPTTAHPNIIDSSNGNLYYKHTFYDGSCGFNSTLGTVYPNSFYVSAVCVSPCGTGADPVGPIYISESPTAGINGPSETCTQTNETFTDNSTSGNAISLNGTTCNTVTKGVWKIFPSTYTVNSGTLGSTPSQSYISDLGYWTTGSNSINVQFNQAGTYTVRRIIGLTSSNDPLCTIDSVDHIICVDTVPIASLLLALPDTSCVSNMLNTSMNLDSINCSEVSKYQFSVYDSTYTSLIYQSSNSTNTNFSWTPSSKGTYVIEYSASNSCGVNSLLDTIVIFDASFNINLNSCAPWSPIISHVINGDNLSYSWTITPNGTFTSLATLTNANTNSPILSFAGSTIPSSGPKLYADTHGDL